MLLIVGYTLSCYTGCGSCQTDALLQAAGEVGDSLSHLVTSLKSIPSPGQGTEQRSANSSPPSKALCHQARFIHYQ